MHKSNKSASLSILQLTLDIIFVISSYFVAYFISSLFVNLGSIKGYGWILILHLPVWILLMKSFYMYNITTFVYYDRVLRNILFSSLTSGIILAAMMFFIEKIYFNKIFFSSFIIVSIPFVVIERFLYIYFIKRFRSALGKNVILIGVTEVADKFNYYVKKTNLQINILGFIHVSGDKPTGTKRNLGNIEDIETILKKHVIDEVIFTLPKDYVGDVEKYVRMCEDMGITVRMVLDLYDLKYSKTYLSCIGPLPMLTFHSVSQNKLELFLKRVMDIGGSIIGLMATSFLYIFISIGIKSTSRGPVVFSQDRVGLNGRIFKLYKFRSMYIDAEERKSELMKQNQVAGGLMFKIKHDPRITPIGHFLRKTSLDEFPQFLNVLRGEMSLVGTRPPTKDEVAIYERHHHRRISMKPGLTGLWQVSGRSSITDFDKVVKLDTEYIDNWSLWLDIAIIFKTLMVVFKNKGAM